MSTEKEFKDKYKGKGGFKSALQDIRDKFYIKSNSFKNWKGLHELACKNNVIKNSDDSFFISEQEKIIFALTRLDGEIRAEMLGIKKEMYSSLKESINWRRKIISVVHPDRCKHPMSNKAVAELNNIYERMKKNGN